jgi:hypothetical protein
MMPNDPTVGNATFTYATPAGTGDKPAPVTPLPALANQAMAARMAEPFLDGGMGGAIVFNPRDGLVSILVFVGGEEWFQDNNSNGIRDPGESFIDQGEPFVDSNDNGVQDVGEQFIDLGLPDGGPVNLVWDGPNGQWDGNTIIWTETRVLWSGPPVAVNVDPIPGFQGFSCPLGLAKGSMLNVPFAIPDSNLNHVAQGLVTLNVTHTGNRGMVSPQNTTIVDDFGFSFDRYLIDASDNTMLCSPTTPICVYRYLFFDWRAGATGAYGLLQAPPTTDMGMCAADTIQFKATTTQTIQTNVSGSWQ